MLYYLKEILCETTTINKLFTASAIAGTALLLLIAPTRAQQPDPGEATDLSVNGKASDIGIEEIVVTGRARKLYRVQASDTAKLSVDPLSSSQLITGINAQLILDQGARDAQDIYRNISGVSLFSYAGVTARGFRQEEIFFDGLRGDPYVGFNVPQLFNIERVDFLKGPAGMLYGPGAPGGLFNYVTKKPDASLPSRARIVVGDKNRYGGSLELNGGTGLADSAWRVGVFYEERDTPRFNTASDTAVYDLGASFILPGDTRLVLQATRYEQDLKGNRLRGVPVSHAGDFLTDRRWNHNEPSDFLNLESHVLQALFDGAINEQLTWNFKIRFTDAEQEQNYHEPIQLVDLGALRGAPDGRPDLVARQFRDQRREERQLSLGTNWIYSAKIGAVGNRLLSGFEYFDGEQVARLGGLNPTRDMLQRFLQGRSLPTDIIPLSITDPVYGITQPGNYAVGFFPKRRTVRQRQGIYLLNEATLGRWIAAAGIRFDDFKDTSTRPSFADDKVSLRFGLVHRVRDDISLFAQWSESYEPQSIGSQVAGAGGPFEPSEGTITEVGIKTELFEGGLSTSAAAYEIVRKNILQADPAGDPEGDGVDNFVQFGEVTSRGFEIDAAADITPNWVLTASYGYNDTRTTADNGGGGIRNNVGERFANAPRHQFGFWTRYQVPAINTAFALGGDYVDERLSLSGQRVKSYTVYDASVIWEHGRFTTLLRIENLFDDIYAESGFLSRTGHFPGDPRTYFFEIYAEW